MIIFLISFSGGCIKKLQPESNKSQTGITKLVTVPPDVPAEYRDQYIKIMFWLDQKEAEWKPSNQRHLQFAAYHVFASDNVFVRSNEKTDLEFLDVLEQTNSDIIVLYIRPDSYFSQKERYDTIINKIRKSGKKLFIGARFDELKIDIREYENELNDYTKNIIAEINPDYFGIVIEPMTMERRHNFEASDEEWVELVRNVSELSKKLNPNIKTAVAGHKLELEFLRLASNIRNVDIVGFNIYGNDGIYSEYSGNLGKGDIVGDTIDYANSKGKETWILETWVADINAGRLIKMVSTQEYMKPIDAKWIQVITYYAMRHNMKAITPFYTGKFVIYTDDPIEFEAALNNNNRTPTFQSYVNIIQEFKK